MAIWSYFGYMANSHMIIWPQMPSILVSLETAIKMQQSGKGRKSGIIFHIFALFLAGTYFRQTHALKMTSQWLSLILNLLPQLPKMSSLLPNISARVS
jgi:hypothetical protein